MYNLITSDQHFLFLTNKDRTYKITNAISMLKKFVIFICLRTKVNHPANFSTTPTMK